MKYNRADINSTMNAAMRISQNKTVYVFATCNGFTIADKPADFGQKCYKVSNGKVEKVGNWK